MYRLVALTQYWEDYGGFAKPKGGSTYLVAELTLSEVVALGKSGMGDMVRAAAEHIEYKDGLTEEYILNWEILAPGELTEEEGWARDEGRSIESDAPISGPYTKRLKEDAA